MQHLKPKCVNNNQAFEACCNINCKANAFLCKQVDCTCNSNHAKCFRSMRWDVVKKELANKVVKYSTQIKAFVEKVNALYDHINKQIKISHDEFLLKSQTYGLNQIESDIWKKIKQGNGANLKGNQFHNMYIQMQMEDGFTFVNIDNESIRVKELVSQLTSNLDHLTKTQNLKCNWLNSKVTNQYDTLCSFFPYEHIKFNLLYRATQNEFSAAKFHQKCDGISGTVTLVKTQFGKVIGGYTNMKWDKTKNGYLSDKKQSFLFSINEKNRLNVSAQWQKQIWTGASYGPIFGGGHDICIHDKANTVSTNYGNIGYTYKSEIFHSGCQETYTKWSGQTSSHTYKIQEWEVHHLEIIQ